MRWKITAIVPYKVIDTIRFDVTISHTSHVRQKWRAELPMWWANSDARGLSHATKSTGHWTRLHHTWRCLLQELKKLGNSSYYFVFDLFILQPRACTDKSMIQYILFRSFAISFPSVAECSKFDAQIKWMLLNFVTSFLGRPARNIE